MLRNKWHAITLSEYIRQKMISRGLHITKSPSFAKDNTAFISAWNSILYKYYFALMALTIQFLNEDEQSLEGLSENNPTVLKQMEKIDVKLTEYAQEIKEQKKKKFLRDEKDYKIGHVYFWSKPESKPTTSLFRPKRSYQQKSHSDTRQCPFFGYKQLSTSATDNKESKISSQLPKKTKRTRRGKRKGSMATSTALDSVSTHSRKSSVINLSQLELTAEQISVLKLGLSFVPTPSISDFELFVDLQRFFRDIRRKEFFMDSNCKLDKTDKFYIKS